MRIGVAGGIGSGKSTVVDSLKMLLPTYRFHSMDEAVRDMYEKDTKWRARLWDILGTNDRATVSSMAFRNEGVRQFVMRESAEHLMNVLKKWLKEENVVVEIPLMFDMGLEKKFDLAVLITAEEETRIARVCKRDNKTAEEVRLIMEKQMKDDEKIPRAGLVVSTNSNTPIECATKIVDFISEKV